MRVFYFGCRYGKTGHYLFEAGHEGVRWDDGDRLSSLLGTRERRLDTGFCPRSQQRQGTAALHHHRGHSLLAWWDRSVDKRTGSNSVVIADEAGLSYERMMELLAEHFPDVLARQPASICLVAEP